MTRPSRSALLATALVVVASLAAGAWWFDRRTHADAVTDRVSARIVAAHAGSSVAPLGRGLLRIAMASGVYVDARLASTFVACRDDRFGCASAIDRVVSDVGRTETLVDQPTLDRVRPVVVAESTPGFRYGYLTEPVIGPLEVRYALVSGSASTFITSAIADRLGVDRAGLKRAAIASLAAEGEPRIELLADGGLYRVVSTNDPVAALLDTGRMKRLAAIVGSPTIYCAVPERGVLVLARADDTSRRALAAFVARARPGDLKPGEVGILAYDPRAPEGSGLTLAEAR